MIGNRIEISAPLRLLSDLHVGSDTGAVFEQDAGTLSKICRDHSGAPIVPASSLKGAIRASLDDGLLWGEITDHDAKRGKIGRLWIDDAPLHSAATEDLSRLHSPAKGQGGDTQNGVYSRVGLAIDGDLGTADPNKLFHKEFVAAGAEFSFAATWFGKADAPELLWLLKFLGEGFCLGAQTTKGAGRVQVMLERLELHQRALDSHGKLARHRIDLKPLRPKIASAPSPEEPKRRFVGLKLTCNGPFMSVHGEQSEGNHKVTVGLERDGRPYLWPHSVIGALRARAHWLCQSDAPEEPQEVADLFGSEAARARIEVQSLRCIQPGEAVAMTSVNIDRVTSGGIDGMLYTEATHWGTVFKLGLWVPQDCNLWEQIQENLTINGLELGHGASKGFGWFDVEVIHE